MSYATPVSPAPAAYPSRARTRVRHASPALMRERRPGIKPSAEEPRDDFGSWGLASMRDRGPVTTEASAGTCSLAARTAYTNRRGARLRESTPTPWTRLVMAPPLPAKTSGVLPSHNAVKSAPAASKSLQFERARMKLAERSAPLSRSSAQLRPIVIYSPSRALSAGHLKYGARLRRGEMSVHDVALIVPGGQHRQRRGGAV